MRRRAEISLSLWGVAAPFIACCASLLAARPAAAGERVALLPLEPVGIEADAARRLEAEIGEALRALGLEVQSPAEIQAVLDRPELVALRSCSDSLCLARLAAALNVDQILSGALSGLGSFESLLVRRSDRSGATTAQASEVLSGSGVERTTALHRIACALAPTRCQIEPLRAAVPTPLPGGAGMASARSPLSAAAEEGVGGRGPEGALGHTKRIPWALTSAGTGTVALALGVLSGLSAQAAERAIDQHRTGCGGAGEEYATCFQKLVGTGRSRAALANWMFVSSGTLLGIAGALWLWPEPGEPGLRLSAGRSEGAVVLSGLLP